jgi:hypothetical protein
MKQHDSIMVAVDKLTKTTHFILVNIIKGFIQLNFWKGLFKGFGKNLNLSIMYHPESDGKMKRANRIIEDMLEMYVMNKTSKWEDYIHLVEFSYLGKRVTYLGGFSAHGFLPMVFYFRLRN